MEACASVQLRVTAARRRLLEILSRETLPVTLDSLASALAGCCDATTVYRTLMLFTAAGLVRQVNLRHKVRHFILNAPGLACDYLICQGCGAITQLPPLESLLRFEQQVNLCNGYTGLRHELELYGICPACRRANAPTPPPNKLPVRN
jgi:Fur family ferric uptake transcriptional regulator